MAIGESGSESDLGDGVFFCSVLGRAGPAESCDPGFGFAVGVGVAPVVKADLIGHDQLALARRSGRALGADEWAAVGWQVAGIVPKDIKGSIFNLLPKKHLRPRLLLTMARRTHLQ